MPEVRRPLYVTLRIPRVHGAGSGARDGAVVEQCNPHLLVAGHVDGGAFEDVSGIQCCAVRQ